MRHRDLLKKIVRTAEARKKDWGSLEKSDNFKDKLHRLITELGYGVSRDERTILFGLADTLLSRRFFRRQIRNGSALWRRGGPNVSLPAVRCEIRRLNREIPRHYTDEREDRNDEIHLDQAS